MSKLQPTRPLPPGASLDPDDWEAFGRLARRTLDETLEWLRTVRERPAWRPLADADRAAFDEPLPRAAQGEEAVYEEFLEHIRAFPHGNQHPGFFGWVTGVGSPLGMVAEMLAAGLNPNVAGFEHAAVAVEHRVLEWFRDVFGMPETAGGVLVSGCSVANLTGLAAARNRAAGYDVRALGLVEGGERLRVYASDQAHSSIQKAVELLGLGRRGLRLIPARDDFQLDAADLRAAIRADREAGVVPAAVVASAGTVDTGAVDDLAALADVCAEEGLWLHVDGAIGAVCALSDGLRHLVAGLERADSVAFDFHKWLHQPFDAGCILVRDLADLEGAFSVQPPYLKPAARGVNSSPLQFSGRSLQLGRGFRALKIWMSLKAQGAARFAALMDRNVAQARRLAAKVEASPVLELLAPVTLSIVCFRFEPEGMDDERADALNQELLVTLQEEGRFVVSSTVIRGRFSLRAAIVNHRTRDEDIDLLAADVERLGRRLAGRATAGADA